MVSNAISLHGFSETMRAQVGDYKLIFGILFGATLRYERPQITFQVGEQVVRLSAAGESEGNYLIADGSGNSTPYGFIDRYGEFRVAGHCTAEIINFLLELGRNPQKYVISRHGEFSERGTGE